MGIRRGFPNIQIIQRSIRELYRRISPKVLGTFTSGYHATRAERPSGDSVIATQLIARRIAQLYRLPIGSVVVSFVSHLARPGQIELSNSNDFFIELHAEHCHSYERVAAILAHEIAHIFCHRLGISIGNTFEDEVLTDTTAAYLGAGVPILNAFDVESGFTLETPNRMRLRCFGYITPDEFGYLLAKRHAALGEDPKPFLVSKLGIEAYRFGRGRAQRDMRSPPLRSANVASWAAYRARRHFFTRKHPQEAQPRLSERERSGRYEFENSQGHAVLFDCPTCFQRLRLPIGRSNILVRCPNCRERFACAT
jgi:hypothetical protein